MAPSAVYIPGSPVLAPFAALRGTRPHAGKKMGPALIACACASFYMKDLLKDLQNRPARFVQNVGQCNDVFFLSGICRLRRHFKCYTIQTFSAGSFCRSTVYIHYSNIEAILDDTSAAPSHNDTRDNVAF